MGWNPWKEAEKKANQAIDKIIDPATKAAEDAVWDIRRKSYAKIKEVGEQGVRQVQNEAKKLPGMAKDAVDEALKDALAVAASGTFTKAVDIAQTVAPDEMGLKVGPFGMVVADVKSRIDTLQRWAKKPPRSKSDIKEMIITLAPTSVSVEVDVQFAALVVSSDSLEVGFSASWDIESFIEKFDDIVKHF